MCGSAHSGGSAPWKRNEPARTPLYCSKTSPIPWLPLQRVMPTANAADSAFAAVAAAAAAALAGHDRFEVLVVIGLLRADAGAGAGDYGHADVCGHVGVRGAKAVGIPSHCGGQASHALLTAIEPAGPAFVATVGAPTVPSGRKNLVMGGDVATAAGDVANFPDHLAALPVQMAVNWASAGLEMSRAERWADAPVVVSKLLALAAVSVVAAAGSPASPRSPTSS